MPRLTLIDNYDSFTYNLYHFLGELGAEVRVYRNDALSAADVLAEKPDGLVLSPGPCTPNEAGISLELVRLAAEHGRLPLLGVCLGHQAMGQVFGAKVVRGPQPVHGKTSSIQHKGSGLFAGLPNPLEVTRYHSLVLEPASMPKALQIQAQSADGVVQAMEHLDLPLYGVQFHPESIASEHGKDLLANFLKRVRGNGTA